MRTENDLEIPRLALVGLGGLAAAIAALQLVARAFAIWRDLDAPVFRESDLISGGPTALAEQLDAVLTLFCVLYLATYLGWLGSWRWHEALVALAALGPLAFVLTALAVALGRETDASNYDYFVFEVFSALAYFAAAALFASAARLRFRRRGGPNAGERKG